MHGSKEHVLRTLASSKTIEHKTSFGAPKSRTDTFPKKVGPDRFRCRMSIGFESQSTVVGVAAAALLHFQNPPNHPRTSVVYAFESQCLAPDKLIRRVDDDLIALGFEPFCPQ